MRVFTLVLLAVILSGCTVQHEKHHGTVVRAENWNRCGKTCHRQCRIHLEGEWTGWHSFPMRKESCFALVGKTIDIQERNKKQGVDIWVY